MPEYCDHCHYFSKIGFTCYCPQTDEEFCDMAEYVQEGAGAYLSPEYQEKEVYIKAIK